MTLSDAFKSGNACAPTVRTNPLLRVCFCGSVVATTKMSVVAWLAVSRVPPRTAVIVGVTGALCDWLRGAFISIVKRGRLDIECQRKPVDRKDVGHERSCRGKRHAAHNRAILVENRTWLQPGGGGTSTTACSSALSVKSSSIVYTQVPAVAYCLRYERRALAVCSAAVCCENVVCLRTPEVGNQK